MTDGSCFQKMNNLAKDARPFLFVLDFDLKSPVVIPLDRVDGREILFSVNGKENFLPPSNRCPDICFEKIPPGYEAYKKSFNNIQQHIHAGNTYLLNLTFESGINTNLSLKEIFLYSKAKYKIWFRDRFVVFSPESFIRIHDWEISTFPMKGTIDAGIPDAGKIILSDKKEQAEHATIVDLMRNDLSMVAQQVSVKRYRYVDKINTSGKGLLQISSEISGFLRNEFYRRPGDILLSILPAGSISVAPKKKTIDIIHETENYERGYFTGVFGIFDGKNSDSAVMIRYIEQRNNELFFKSGGGITSFSDPHKEYQELVDKIYLPIPITPYAIH